jgi:type IV secretion system protein VirB3
VVITPYAAALGIMSWTVIVAALRRMAKSDPMMRRVYLRHIRYRPVYRATSTPFVGR